MIGTIYRLISPSGKSYIGQTTNFNRRMKTFYKSNYRYSGKRMEEAIQKYGRKSFKSEILLQIVIPEYNEEVQEVLYLLEEYYIQKYDSYNNGYNMTLGGAGSKGCYITEEMKYILSIKATGRPSANKGKPLSEKQKRLLSERGKLYVKDKNPFFGKKYSDKTKRAIGDANSKAVVQIDVESGKILREFSSAKAAGLYLGKPRGNSEIIKVCKHYISPSNRHYVTAFGYKWEYKESSTTIPKGSTSQANGDGNGELRKDEDIVSPA